MIFERLTNMCFDFTGTPATPKVSVIVPCYNVAEFIEQTLQSLLNQTLDQYELILIDDGSTDETYKIAKRYALMHTNITIITQSNKGLAGARNTGLRKAQGSYLCFVDSDDILALNALEVMYNAALEYDADLIMGGVVRFNSQSIWKIQQYVDYGVMEPGVKTLATHPGLFYAMISCGKLYRRDLIHNIFFPEHMQFCEDQPFVVYAYSHANRIYTVEDIVYYWRVREGNNPSLSTGSDEVRNPA